VLSARDSEADIVFDPQTANPHFSFIEDDGNRHDVWFLDAVTAFNEIETGNSYRVAGYAIWRLGAEDPSVWSAMGQAYGISPPAGLDVIGTSQDIDFEGEGEMLRVGEKPAPGARTFEVDQKTGQIVDEVYKVIPTPFLIERTGDKPNLLALTFDDGPDPDWTPKILDILKEKGIHASFFIVGENAQASPDLVQRILAEGHDVGNHTFTHPNLGDLSDSLVTLEINATQRLFEALTGRSMRLFRAPFLGDAEPTTSDEIVPIEIAQSMGYVTVGLHVDTNDWLHPPADVIVDRVLDRVSDPNPDMRGHIILLHDSGGDRSATVAALPKLIDTLRAKGYQFVPVSELAGLTRDQAMPPVPPRALGQFVSLPVFMTLGWIGRVLTAMFILALCLGMARVFLITAVGLSNRRSESRRVPPRLPDAPPLQTVLIPAHNEAKVIVGSVGHILASDYPNLEVIVIDDGSTDGTGELVSEHYRDDPRVKLLTIPNRGKATALNSGLKQARGSVVVALDADTHFEGDAISKLVRWFEDPAVAAVAGNAKVGNRVNVITRWQALEYVTSQNLERRALAALGCITVVPGAIGAWRREAVEQLGGFSVDTLAEDQDLTIALLRAGYKVLYDSSAVGWTEAPDTLTGPCQTTFPLGLRHPAMPVEAPARDVSSSLRRIGPHRFATDLAVSIPSLRGRTPGGCGAHLATRLFRAQAGPASGSIQSGRVAQGAHLLSRLPHRRFGQRGGGPRHGAAGKVVFVALARAAALRLPAVDVLHRSQGIAHRGSRTTGRLGQARAQVDRQGCCISRLDAYSLS
jgi:peptidoglycan/xylan/chitin deacetylase (PgdA/CDA1 family)